MSELEKKRSELAVLELCEQLEVAREAMHDDRSDEGALAEYNRLSNEVAAARSEHRKNFPIEVPDTEDEDGVALVEPVEVTGEVKPE